MTGHYALLPTTPSRLDFFRMRTGELILSRRRH
jgi:hypothetical protein